MEIVTVEREIRSGADSYRISLDYLQNEDGGLTETDEIRKKNTQTIMDVARKIMHYLSGKEIADIRSKYGASQEHFSLLLGLGRLDIRDYEYLTVPSKDDNYYILDHDDPLIFLGSLFRYRYRIKFTDYLPILDNTLALLDNKVDRKSIENLLDKWGDYNNTGFYTNILTKLGGTKITFKDYEKIIHVQELKLNRFETKLFDYGDRIKIYNLKDKLQHWLDEEKFDRELGYKSYTVASYDPSWDSLQDDKEDENM